MTHRVLVWPYIENIRPNHHCYVRSMKRFVNFCCLSSVSSRCNVLQGMCLNGLGSSPFQEENNGVVVAAGGGNL